MIFLEDETFQSPNPKKEGGKLRAIVILSLISTVTLLIMIMTLKLP